MNVSCITLADNHFERVEMCDDWSPEMTLSDVNNFQDVEGSF
jgi:hypothetical protein